MELFAFISLQRILGKRPITFTKKSFLGQPSGLSSTSFSSDAGNGSGPRRRIISAKKRVNSKRRNQARSHQLLHANNADYNSRRFAKSPADNFCCIVELDSPKRCQPCFRPGNSYKAIDCRWVRRLRRRQPQECPFRNEEIRTSRTEPGTLIQSAPISRSVFLAVKAQPSMSQVRSPCTGRTRLVPDTL